MFRAPPGDSPLLRRPPPARPASFHGSPAKTPPELRRPKTLPELLESRRRLSPAASPAKILVKVTVQRSLGPVQAMAPANWTVRELTAAVIKIYVDEERLPLLCSLDPSAFGLHFSQFCLECLDSDEKLIDLGSRNFFLCPKREYESATGDRLPAAVAAATAASSPWRCWKEAEKRSRIGIPWLRFMN